MESYRSVCSVFWNHWGRWYLTAHRERRILYKSYTIHQIANISIISCFSVGVLLTALCKLFPFLVRWPDQVWWLAGASRARWASCWPGALQKLTRLTRYQMALEHQQAGKYNDTHTHKSMHRRSCKRTFSHTFYIRAHTGALMCAIKSRALGNTAALQWVWMWNA